MIPKKSSTPRKPRAVKAEAGDGAAPVKKAAPRKKKAPEPKLQAFIDYPKEGELVSPGQYTFRLGTHPAAVSVEVSLDEGEFNPARESGGYWWYDWRDYEPGPHKLTVRAADDKGETARAERAFTVSVETEWAADGPGR